ncbi:MAG: ABC transporter permease [Candidatus Nealsonbacteria bacterium]|nr:ABC transporter permease [Candidatus Nealsonbacteria bacterium]
MKLPTLVWRELFERKSQMLTIFLGVFLGITAVVAIKNITVYRELAVARELDLLGANVLVLPKSVTLQDYYSADMHDEVIPEEYVMRLTMSKIQGVDNLSPKLCVPVTLEDRNFTLTGILPKNEFQAKAAWAGVGIFSRPIGCGTVDMGAEPEKEDKKTLVRKRVIETLESDESLVGADVASSLGLEDGDSIELLGKEFSVVAVLPQTGTVDDSRIFAHLHTVQELTNKGEVVSCIEIVGCCKEISAGLVDKVNTLLPDAKVVTVTQVVATQTKVNEMMEQGSLLFLIILVVVGGAGIANYMYANVFERRREIGTLMALGAGSRTILGIFLLKALLLGLAGGVGGVLVGTGVSLILGPMLAGLPALAGIHDVEIRGGMLMLATWAVLISTGIALAASFLPAWWAARLDPCATFQEI